MHLFKNDHAPGDPLMGHFRSQSSFFRAQYLVVSNRGIFYVFNFQVNVDSLTSRLRPFLTYDHNLNKIGGVPQGDVMCQISKSFGICFTGKICLMFSLYNELIGQISRKF